MVPPSDVCWFITPSKFSYLMLFAYHTLIGITVTNLANELRPHPVLKKGSTAGFLHHPASLCRPEVTCEASRTPWGARLLSSYIAEGCCPLFWTHTSHTTWLIQNRFVARKTLYRFWEKNRVFIPTIIRIIYILVGSHAVIESVYTEKYNAAWKKHGY